MCRREHNTTLRGERIRLVRCTSSPFLASTDAVRLEAVRQRQQQQKATSATSFSPGSVSALPGQNRFTRPPPPEFVISPYMLTSSISNGEAARPVSAEVGGPGMGAHAPWETTAATTTLPEQFEQMCVTWADPVSARDHGS